MLLVKCGQCGASYKLPEELYRRKAAGFGVVVTCRRCKTEIHVDAEPPTMRGEDLAENDAAPTAPTHERPEPPATLDEETPLPTRTPEPALAKTPEPATKLAPKAPSAASPVVTKPPLPIPRAPGAARPAAATVKGIGVDAVKDAAARRATEAKVASPPAPRVQPQPRKAPKLVALSPGLLGTITAPKPPVPPSPAVVSPPPPATAASPSPPATALPPVSPAAPAVGMPSTPKPARDPEEAAWDPSVPPPPPEPPAPDSEIAVASQDFRPVDSAPSSELSVESKDFIGDVSGEGAPIEKEPDAPKKRFPEAPGVRRVPKAEPKSEELPSTTGTPKLDTLIHGPALPLDQKKGEPPRKRQPSGDLSDDFMSADLGFDSPALAPPNADALSRAPVSSRPGAAAASTQSSPPVDATNAKSVTSKSARPVSVRAEKKAASGRGWLALLLLAVLGVGGFSFRHRLGRGPGATPEDVPAASPPASEPAPPEVPAQPAAAPAEPSAPAAEPSVEGVPAAPAASPENTARAPSPGATAGTPQPKAPAATTPQSSLPSTAPKAAPAADLAAPEPTPTSPAKPIEPRPPVGTEPFDADAARAALDASAAQASTCRKPGDPSGVAVVIITFSPTGRVTTANISGPPFAATPTGGCIASTLRKTRVPAFAGDMVTVRKTVTIN
jgi:hypothetical protein